MILAAAFAVGLSACGTPQATVDISKQIQTAESYVNAAFAAVDGCIALQVPICQSPDFRAGVAKAKVVATQALAEAKAYPVNGDTQDKIQAALRVAMNSVALFFSLQADRT
ncbi:MAG TPA: hypothetical protein VN838_16160 [Bradyrhizobium sp.]|nr:hypothetical protein [Bradyrhizobium sp.]